MDGCKNRRDGHGLSSRCPSCSKGRGQASGSATSGRLRGRRASQRFSGLVRGGLMMGSKEESVGSRGTGAGMFLRRFASRRSRRTAPAGRIAARQSGRRDVPASLRFSEIPARSPGWPHRGPSIGAPGFEPGTFGSQSRRATGLRHTPPNGLSRESGIQGDLSRPRDGLTKKVKPAGPPRYPLPFPPQGLRTPPENRILSRSAKLRTRRIDREIASFQTRRAQYRGRRSRRTGGHSGPHNEWPLGRHRVAPVRGPGFYGPSSRPHSRHRGN